MTQLCGLEVGNGAPCRVIAELSNNHNGKLGNALRWIKEVKAAGADYAKFQCYSPDELVALRGDGPAPEPWGSHGWTMRTLYEKAQTPHDWFPALVAKCAVVGIPWFSSVFGLKSLTLLESLGCPAYKIAALDRDSVGLVGAARLTGKPVIASQRHDWYPGEDEDYVSADFRLVCFEGYPQPESVWDWPHKFSRYALYGYDGCSYHGTNWKIPAREAAMTDNRDRYHGSPHASLVEVHVQLDHEPSELEANVSLTVSQLRELCASIRGVR